MLRYFKMATRLLLVLVLNLTKKRHQLMSFLILLIQVTGNKTKILLPVL